MTIQEQINQLDALEAEINRLHQINQDSPKKEPPKREYNTSFFWSFVTFALLAYILSNISNISNISIPVHIVH